MKNREKFEVVGSITVDAGLVQIGDPCYQFTENHNEWLKYIVDTGIADMDTTVAIPHKNKQGNYGISSKAIAVQSGLGDGVYDVLVKKCSETGLVKELKIKFF